MLKACRCCRRAQPEQSSHCSLVQWGRRRRVRPLQPFTFSLVSWGSRSRVSSMSAQHQASQIQTTPKPCTYKAPKPCHNSNDKTPMHMSARNHARHGTRAKGSTPQICFTSLKGPQTGRGMTPNIIATFCTHAFCNLMLTHTSLQTVEVFQTQSEGWTGPRGSMRTTVTQKPPRMPCSQAHATSATMQPHAEQYLLSPAACSQTG